jgi:hypothetical protein
VREKAHTDHAFSKIIVQQRNVNAETASANCVREVSNG